jgi:hypothetical protein
MAYIQPLHYFAKQILFNFFAMTTNSSTLVNNIFIDLAIVFISRLSLESILEESLRQELRHS